jgi:hypothetical protein
MRRNFRRRFGRKRTRIGRPARGLSLSVYKFKRSIVESFNLTDPPAPWDTPSTDAITLQAAFKLNDLHDFDDFTNLFASYKITGVKMEMFFSSTSVAQVSSSGDQMIVYWNKNNLGRADQTLDEQYFLDNQAGRKRQCIVATGKPISFYMPLKQLSERHGGTAGATDYAAVRPKFVSTGEPTCLHYGYNMRLQLINDLAISRTACKCIYTYYVTCRQAQ